MNLTVHPLVPSRWADLEAVFAAPGCAVARGCWCMFYRRSGAHPPPPGCSVAQERHAALKALAERGPPPGLLAYRDGAPVGWVTLGPREHFPKLARSPVMKPVDERPTWSVVCFVVPKRHRGQGVARALLAAAIAHAREQGATLLEAYPVDRDRRSADDAMWFGAQSMVAAAGFVEVARRRRDRPVMRLELERPPR